MKIPRASEFLIYLIESLRAGVQSCRDFGMLSRPAALQGLTFFRDFLTSMAVITKGSLRSPRFLAESGPLHSARGSGWGWM